MAEVAYQGLMGGAPCPPGPVKGALMIPWIDTIIGGVGKVVDKIIPDANVREQVKLAIQQEALDWEKLDQADRDSARKREMTVQDPTVRRLAYIYTGGYFGCLGALMFGWVNVPQHMTGLVDVLFGVLTAGQYSVLQYYFGSSHGSAIKTHQSILSGK